MAEDPNECDLWTRTSVVSQHQTCLLDYMKAYAFISVFNIVVCIRIKYSETNNDNKKVYNFFIFEKSAK